MNTVKWTLLSLCLEEYTHIVVKTRGRSGLVSVGGGKVSSVIERFGNLHITDAFILDGCLVLVVGL